jgi:hypothetical protein
MADFNRILEDVQTTFAAEKADEAISSARNEAERALIVKAARERFHELGVHRFLREQAEAMKASGFWSRYYEDGISDRASASLGFVPVVGEALNERSSFGRLNEFSLIIQAYAGGDVNCRFAAHAYSEDYVRNLPLADFGLDHVRGWFERFVRQSFERRKQIDAERAR